MIEVMVIETKVSESDHAKKLVAPLNDGWDIYSNHVTPFDETILYTTYLTRGSRPGQQNKASQIEILENEIKALKAIAEANSLAIKAVDSRLDATIKDFNAGWDDEAVPNNWLEERIQDMKRNGAQLIEVGNILVRSAYEDAVEEALAEDEQYGMSYQEAETLVWLEDEERGL